MYSTILSGTVLGMESCLVQVEVDLSAGLPCFIMVGHLSGKYGNPQNVSGSR
ncbi:MAG: hypothetical protein V8S42_08385 [Lachnospiraceae bacterium]